MNVLITHLDFQDMGGISSYYKHIYNKFNIPILHFIVGKRPGEKGFLSRISRMFCDYYSFVRCLRISHVDLVHINPSLNLKSFIRDGIFVLLAKVNKKKVIVFFHGWKKSFEVSIKHNFLWLFKFLFDRTDAFIVLSDEIKKTLVAWGLKQPIYLESTVIDEVFLTGFDILNAITKRQNSEKWRVLFLSRIIREKGIYEIVEAVSILQAKYPMLELIVAGDGDELKNVKSFVRERNMLNVTFIGYVRGREKRHLFENAHVFCLPSYREGMPVSVVEAMAFGLPVVTRPVGGIADFFKNEEHGLITTSKQPEVFADLLERLFIDKTLYKKISLCNYQYAQTHFLASNAAIRLETIYKKVLIKRL